MSSLRSDPKGFQLFADLIEHLPNISLERNHLYRQNWNHLPEQALIIVPKVSPKQFYDKKQKSFSGYLDALRSGTDVFIAFDSKALNEELLNIESMGNNDSDGQTCDHDGKCNKNYVTKNDVTEAHRKETHTKDNLSQNIKEQSSSISENNFSGNIRPTWSAPKNWDFQVKKSSDASKQNHQLTFDGQIVPFVIRHELDITTNAHWDVHLSHEQKVLMASHHLYKGRLILSLDDLWLSNQSLAIAKPTKLLQSLFAETRHIVIDESHLGLVRHLGIIDLMVRYRLQGVFISLILIIILVIWSGYVHQPHHNTPSDEGPSQLNIEDGFCTMMRRHHSHKSLLAHCIKLWKKEQASNSLTLDTEHASTLSIKMHNELDGKTQTMPPHQRYNEWQKIVKQNHLPATEEISSPPSHHKSRS
jgi:hypothetical protein